MADKLRILAVDDNIINLATIEQELKSKYEVVTVNSGARAIRFLTREKPALVLLDIQMSAMDGLETLRKIRELKNGANIPVIMLTARKDRETVIEGTKLGIADYVVKPFNAQDLHMRIERALRKAGVVPDLIPLDLMR
ncbi:MAG: response regulator [Blautia sp.]|nr:response regulator [Blautia sp.]